MAGPENRTEPTFGHNAVRHGFATAEQVNECILIQNEERKSGKVPRPLSQIMISRGFLTEEMVQEVNRLSAQERAVPALRIPGYEIISWLGEGGMGTVFKAKQVSMDRLVALKLLPTRLAQNKSYIDRFYQEARAAGRLNHENIVRAYDVGESNGLHFISMEFIEGENVQSMLRKQKHLDEKLVLQIALQIARALDHAHKHSLVHRDIKPENIMITVDGVAKLCDLGLAKDTSGDSSLTQVNTCVGTPHYIAPEQARGDRHIDIRADIYSLGASMFHMLVGEPVFNGPSPAVVMTKHLTEPVPPPHTLRPGISQATSAIVLRCMMKEREARYQTPAELIADIESAMAGGNVARPTLVRAGSPKAENTRRMKDTRYVRAVHAAIDRPQAPRSSPVGLYAGMGTVVVIGVVAAILLAKKYDSPHAPNPVPKVGVTDPAPAVPPTPVVEGPTQAEEDRAKAELDVLEESVAGIRKDPRHFADVVQRYEEFISHKDFKFTKWAREAKKRLEAYKDEIETEAFKLLEPLERQAEALAVEEKFLEAARAFGGFPPELAFTEAGERAVQARDAYLKKWREKFEVDLRKAEQLGSDRKFDAAKKILEALKPLCDEQQLLRVNELLEKTEQARVDYENQTVARAAQAYDELRKSVHKNLRERKFDAARADLERGRKDPALALRAEDLAHDAEEVALLEAVYGDAIEGARKLAKAKQPITLAQFGAPVIPTIDDKDQVVIRFGGATMSLTFDILKRSDVVALAGKVLDGSLPETRFKYGLVYFFGLDPETPPDGKDDTLAKARAELDAARKKDPRADRYYRWLEEMENAAKVREAKKLYGDAKDSYASQRWTEAQNRLSLLLKIYGDLSFVRDRKGEIDGMLKVIAEKFEADKKAFDGLFAVTPRTMTNEGKIDITYDFDSQDQGKDWEARAPLPGQQPGNGSWTIVSGEAMGRGHKSYYWKPKLKGDFSVEFTLTPNENRNLGVQFCDNRAGKFYRAALGYELQNKDLRAALNPKSTSLLKVDVVALREILNTPDWSQTQLRRLRKEALNTLAEGNDPKLAKGKKYHVQVSRIQDNIEFWVNGKSVAKAKDATYKEGFIALWCNSDPANPEDVCGSWDNVRIVGHLDPEWLRQAMRK